MPKSKLFAGFWDGWLMKNNWKKILNPKFSTWLLKCHVSYLQFSSFFLFGHQACQKELFLMNLHLTAVTDIDTIGIHALEELFRSLEKRDVKVTYRKSTSNFELKICMIIIRPAYVLTWCSCSCSCFFFFLYYVEFKILYKF